MGKINKKIIESAKKVKAVILDADGVIFTGQAFVDGEGEKFKVRSHIDGQGISLLRAAGLRMAVVSGGIPAFVESLVRKMNSLPSVQEGRWPAVELFNSQSHHGKGKIDAIEGWLTSLGIRWDEAAYMGDDLGDYQIMRKAGLPVAPAQAEEIIKSIAAYVTARSGGNGAVRDLANLIIEAKKIDPLSLKLK